MGDHVIGQAGITPFQPDSTYVPPPKVNDDKWKAYVDDLGSSIDDQTKQDLQKVPDALVTVENWINKFPLGSPDGNKDQPQDVKDAFALLSGTPMVAKLLGVNGAFTRDDVDKVRQSLEDAADRAKASWDKSSPDDRKTAGAEANYEAVSASLLQAFSPILDVAASEPAADGYFDQKDLAAIDGDGGAGLPTALVNAARLFGSSGMYQDLPGSAVGVPLDKPANAVSGDSIANFVENITPRDMKNDDNSTTSAQDNAIDDLRSAAIQQAIEDNGGDSSKITPDYYNNDGYDGSPGASAADKAAQLFKLEKTAAEIEPGHQYYLQTNDSDQTQGSDPSDWNPALGPTPVDQRKAFEAEIQKRIDKLQSDPDLQNFLNEKVPAALQSLVSKDPGLKDALQKDFDATKDTKNLDDAWKANVFDHKNVLTPGADANQVLNALAQYAGKPAFYSQALGMDDQGLMEAYSHIQGDSEMKAKFDAAQKYVVNDEVNDLVGQGDSVDDATAKAASDLAIINKFFPKNLVNEYNVDFASSVSAIKIDDVTKGKDGSDIAKAIGIANPDHPDPNDPALLKFIDEHKADLDPTGEYKREDIAQAFATLILSYHFGTKLSDALTRLPNTLPDSPPYLKDAPGQKGYKLGLTNAAGAIALIGVLAVNTANGDGKIDPTLATHAGTQTAGLLVETLGKSGYLSARVPYLQKQLAGIADQNSQAAKDIAAKISAATKWGRDFLNVGKQLGGIAGFAGLALSIKDAKDAAESGDKLTEGFSAANAAVFGLLGASATTEAVAYTAGRFVDGLRVGATVLADAAGVATAVLGILGTGLALVFVAVESARKHKEYQESQDKWYAQIKDGIAGTGITPPPEVILSSPDYGYVKPPEGPPPGTTDGNTGIA